MQIDVNSPRGAYRVVVEPQATRVVPQYIPDGARVAVLYPEDLPRFLDQVAAHLSGEWFGIPVPCGEAAKTPAVLQRCWEDLAAHRFTRSDVIVGIGGGTVTDLAGFVAATWLRGVPYVSIPTTVLAMVDAAVGGKTGINLPAGKNLVGAFYEPKAVLCDVQLFESLPQPVVAAGLAEVVKCGFIKDPEILRLVRDDAAESMDVSSRRFAEISARAIQVKADVVAADLTERTSRGSDVGRETLNYGHTLGHAIEAREQYRMAHGEAISIGMVWMAEVSSAVLGLPREAVSLHREILGALGLPRTYQPDAWPELRAVMSVDKKARGNVLRLVGLPEIGHVSIIENVPETVLRECYQRIS